MHPLADLVITSTPSRLGVESSTPEAITGLIAIENRGVAGAWCTCREGDEIIATFGPLVLVTFCRLSDFVCSQRVVVYLEGLHISVSLLLLVITMEEED